MDDAVAADLDAALIRIDRLLEEIVGPLEDKHADLLEDPRARFDVTGCLSAPVLELRRQVRQASAAAGLYLLLAPAELGGGGYCPQAQYQVWEHLHHRCGPDRILPYDTLAHFSNGPVGALTKLSAELKAGVLPDLLAGKRIVCFAMSEPDSAGDIWNMKTRAVKRGTSWHIDGLKQWVSRGPYADDVVVYAVTDDDRSVRPGGGVTAFLVPKDTAGCTVESIVTLFGRIGGDEALLRFDDVEVSDANVIGEVGDGPTIAMSGSIPGMAYTAGRFIGLAWWALDRTAEHVKNRPGLADDPVVQTQLGESAIDIYAARSLALACAAGLEAPGPHGAIALGSARSAALSACTRVYERCILILGGDAITSQTKLFDGWHQAAIVRAAEGGGKSAKQRIAQEVLAAGRLNLPV